MSTATAAHDGPPDAELAETEVPDALPRSIFRLFWLFARPHRTTVVLMMLASLSLRALSVLQFYAMKRMVDTAVRLDLRAPGAWGALRPPLLGFFVVVAVFMVVEWGAWYCSYSSRIPVLARARQLVFTYAQRHSPTYFDNMLTGKVAHRAMLLPEQTVTLFERTNWDYVPLAVQCGLLLVLFFRAQPLFAAILLAWLAVYVAVTVVMGRRIAMLGAAHSNAKAQLTGRIVDSITNIKNVIFFAAHEREDRMSSYSRVPRLAPEALTTPPTIPLADTSADPWRVGSSTLALNLGLGSVVGFAGLTYSRLIGSVFETEVGAGLGFTGVQLSLMQKFALGAGSVRFIMGAGLAYSPGGGIVEPGRQRSLWLNLDLVGIEVRARNSGVFFVSIGDTHEFGAPLEIFSIDCVTDGCPDAKRDFIQLRTGFGVSF